MLSEISERTGRRRDNARRSLVMAEARTLVECTGVMYRLVPEVAAAFDAELKATGIKASERLDRQKYEREPQAYRECLIRRVNQIPEVWPLTEQAGEPELDGYIEDLESIAFADDPGPANGPIPEPQPALERETVQTFGKSVEGS
jgi:hypothetical protein